MRRTIAVIALSVVCLVAAACAHGAPPGSAAKSSDNVITVEDLSAPAIAGLNVYDAIHALRPQFFVDPVAGASNKQGRRLEISVNGGRLRPPSDLYSIPVAPVREIRYFSSGESVGRFGMRANLGPVILVTLVASDTTRAP